MAEGGTIQVRHCTLFPRESGDAPEGRQTWRRLSRERASGGPVAESAVAPPGPIPNPVVTHRSAGEYLGSDSLGGEAAAGPPGAGLMPAGR